MEIPEDPEDARLEAAARMCEAMAAKLRKLKKRTKKQTKKQGSRQAVIKEGDRIQMVRPKDPHNGRKGDVLKRQGTMFWNLRLDADARQEECFLWRMDSSLRVLESE